MDPNMFANFGRAMWLIGVVAGIAIAVVGYFVISFLLNHVRLV